MTDVNVTVFCFLASYLIALALEGVRLVRWYPTGRTLMLLAALAGFVAHTWYLLIRSTKTELPPLLSSTHDWLLVLAWMGVLFYLILTAVERDLAVGLFLLPLVLALIGAAYFVSEEPNRLLGHGEEQVRQAVRGWAMLHASLLVFGIAGVIVGFVLSMMYLVQHRRLKSKQTLESGLTLPSLERLARLNWWAVILSVPLLTLGMLTGVVLGLQSKQGPDPVSFRDPVVIGSGVAWGVMVVFFLWLLRARHTAGKQVAWRTVWAFGFLLVTLVGLQVLTGGGTSLLKSWHARRDTGTRSRETDDGSVPPPPGSSRWSADSALAGVALCWSVPRVKVAGAGCASLAAERRSLAGEPGSRTPPRPPSEGNVSRQSARHLVQNPASTGTSPVGGLLHCIRPRCDEIYFLQFAAPDSSLALRQLTQEATRP